MEQKKPTAAQLQRRLQNAVLHIDKDRSYEGVYFSDKGLRLEVVEDYCIIATGFHRHVFDKICLGQGGYSRPYLYTKRVIEIANENLEAIKTDAGYSFQTLLEVLKAKEDQAEYNICVFFSWWCLLIFNPLYSIAEDDVSSFFVFFKYCCVLAQNHIILDEHKEDVTTKQFVERFKELITEFIDGNEERVLFHALSDEERMKQEMEAIQANANDELMKGQA